MNNKIHGWWILVLFFVAIICSSCLNNNGKKLSKNPNQLDTTNSVLKKIRETGTLIALTDYNSTNYFIYRGEPMGYQFDLLKVFADHIGVDLEVVTSNDLGESFASLQKGEIDLLAIGLAKTSERKEIVDFTDPLDQTRQVLVQRKPENWRKIKTMDELETYLIRKPLDLAGKTVYIQKNTSHKTRLVNLMEEIGDSINIVEVNRETEELISDVASGAIDYTISDENVALVNSKYYPDIDVKTPISFTQNLSWAVAKGQDSLLMLINDWLAGFKKSYVAGLLYNKYFENTRTINYAKSEYHSIGGGKISRYDDIVKEISKKYDLDWRLVSSIIYQESGFKPNARSWVGAYGLMQLMPKTAQMFGADTLSGPKEQIEAGVKFIKWLDQNIPEEITDANERTKFVLAAYNVGLAHVFDARRLAEKYNRNPNIWTGNVDTFILKKSNPKYYRDSVVRYGYCRGEEPYNFVREILDRYEHYKNLIK